MTSDLAAASDEATGPTGLDRFEFEPHNCFACGELNDGGLRMVLHLGERRSWSELTLDSRFEGWVEVAHGGIVATILDEVMAWSLVAEDNWGVTARMSIGYRRPIPIGQPIRAEGWIVRSRRRLVETAGRIVTGDGTELATAEGLYVAADAARKRELQARYGYRARAARDATSETATPDTGDGPR